MSPFEPKTNPTTGSRTLSVSIVFPIPTSISAIEPSMPTFQPLDLRNWSSDACVRNAITIDFACAPAWKPIDPDVVR